MISLSAGTIIFNVILCIIVKENKEKLLQAKCNTKETLSGQMSYFKWGSVEESDETVALSWKSINDKIIIIAVILFSKIAQ